MDILIGVSVLLLLGLFVVVWLRWGPRWRTSWALGRARLRHQWQKVPRWFRLLALLLLALGGGGGAFIALLGRSSSASTDAQGPVIILLLAIPLSLTFVFLLLLERPGFAGYQPPVKGQVIARSDFGERVEQVDDQLYLVVGQRSRWGVSERRDVITRGWLVQALDTSVWIREAEEGTRGAGRRPGWKPQFRLKGKKLPGWFVYGWFPLLFFLVVWFSLVIGFALTFRTGGTAVGECVQFLAVIFLLVYTPFALNRFNRAWQRLWGAETAGKVIARSVSGERVEESSGKLWLVRQDGSRDEVTRAWLEQALEGTAWKREEAAGLEPVVSGQEERIEEASMPQEWETEIASDLSFRDRITPEMLSHVPEDKRGFALQEYARLHPEEAYWDGQALVRKGKQK